MHNHEHLGIDYINNKYVIIYVYIHIYMSNQIDISQEPLLIGIRHESSFNKK